MEIKNYSEKSFILMGDTKKFKKEIKELGGKWCPKLKNKYTDETFGAWIFSNLKRENVEEWIKGKTSMEMLFEKIKKLEDEIVLIKKHLDI